MKFLPIHNERLQTKLRLEEVQKRLLENTAPPSKSIFFPQKSNLSFSGTIGEENFNISRSISYKNSFLPIIEGKLSQTIWGTEIELNYQLHLFVKVFMFFWLSIIGLVGIIALSAAVSENKFSPDHFIPLGMFLFGILLAILPFRYEVGKSRAALCLLLEAELMNENVG